MYSVELTQRAKRFLRKLDIQTKTRIEQALKRLEQQPVPKDAKFLGRQSGEKVFRFRIGVFRALYTINESSKVLLVHKIEKRSRVYQR